MAKQKKRRIGQCVYCGAQAEVSTDHVIPKGLFKRPFPLNLITVPACDPCNNAKSLNDDYLRDLLTSDVFGNRSPVASDIFHEKVLSSTRKGKSVIARTAVNKARLEPFYTRRGVYLGDVMSAPIDSDRVTQTLATIVRGLYYDHRKQRIPNNYVFEVYRIFPWDFSDVWDGFKKMNVNGPRILGNVFGCAYLCAEEDAFTTVWLLWFYERVFFSVAVTAPTPEARSVYNSG